MDCGKARQRNSGATVSWAATRVTAVTLARLAGRNPPLLKKGLQISRGSVKCGAHLAQVAELVDALVSGTSG
ncbi:hypothetical protein SAMD00023378_2888 [Ralstonia sp. NT80]|nr:hypothetical protein SAMD00023378_2888 [Ralstonia sp. NT80]